MNHVIHHLIALVVRGFLGAAFLTFCWMIAPYVREGRTR